MAELKDKVKLALDEARMLILGAQILLGFEYRSYLEPGVDALPRSWRYVKLLSLIFILLTNCLLMWPATFQQLCERGEATKPVERFANRVMCYALLPFAASMGIEFFTTFGKFGGTAAGVVAGVITLGAAVFFWYVLGFWRRSVDGRSRGGKAVAAAEVRRRRAMDQDPHVPSRSRGADGSPNGDGDVADRRAGGEGGGTPLKDKINDVLTEGRVILPGAQAVLGFQLIVMLSPGFDKLPLGSQYVHLASLALIALSTILLMTAPAYHRIVEHGESTPHFFRFSSRMLLASMVPLAAGMAGDFFVVARKVTHSAPGSVVASVALLAFFYGAWFGYAFFRRARDGSHETAKRPSETRELAGAA